jgi:hypothetical protein
LEAALVWQVRQFLPSFLVYYTLAKLAEAAKAARIAPIAISFSSRMVMPPKWLDAQWKGHL